MRNKIKKIVDIHAADRQLRLLSGLLLLATVLAIGSGISLIVMYIISEFHSVIMAIGVALILTGAICFVAWKRKVWNTFVHHLTELS
jgi:hypothetical protein